MFKKHSFLINIFLDFAKTPFKKMTLNFYWYQQQQKGI